MPIHSTWNDICQKLHVINHFLTMSLIVRATATTILMLLMLLFTLDVCKFFPDALLLKRLRGDELRLLKS